MKSHSHTRWAAWLSSAAMLLACHGCLGVVEQGIDLVASPQAVENLLALPLAGLAPIAQLVLRFVS